MQAPEPPPRASDATVVTIGIDVGTTNLKLLAATPSGAVLHGVSRPMVVHRPEPGWADFDLEALDDAILNGLTEIVENLPAGASVAAIAVDSIGESFVGVDADGAIITSCPTWFDRRTSNARNDLGIEVDHWYDVTGMADDDIATIHRLHWLMRHGLVDNTRVRTWMNVADYCTYRLSGEAVAAPSLAARSGLFDRTTGGWSSEFVHAVGLHEDQLPRAQPAATIAGGLLPDVARRIGLPCGTPVVNAGHDHPCAGVACKVLDMGSLMDSTGTAEAVKTVVAGPLRYDETLQGRYDCYPHAVPGRFLLSGHLPSAGGFIAWLTRALTGDEAGRERSRSQDDLLAEALESLPGARGIRVLPFLEGTGAPYNERAQTAEFVGLRGFHRRADLLRAAYEGCAFWLEVNVATMARIVGGQIDTIIAVGGGARSDLWLQIKAALLQRPITVPQVTEAAALGAAFVGGIAVGAIANLEALPTLPSRAISADDDLRAAYAPVAADYRRIHRQRFGAL